MRKVPKVVFTLTTNAHIGWKQERWWYRNISMTG